MSLSRINTQNLTGYDLTSPISKLEVSPDLLTYVGLDQLEKIDLDQICQCTLTIFKGWDKQTPKKDMLIKDHPMAFVSTASGNPVAYSVQSCFDPKKPSRFKIYIGKQPDEDQEKNRKVFARSLLIRIETAAGKQSKAPAAIARLAFLFDEKMSTFPQAKAFMINEKNVLIYLKKSAGICRIYDFFPFKSCAYIYEKLFQKNLLQYAQEEIKTHTHDRAELITQYDSIKPLIEKILVILTSLREKAVVHGDLTLKNFLVNCNRREVVELALCDFETAKVTGKPLPFEDSKWTTHYLAPELWEDAYTSHKWSPSHAHDLWACGIIIFGLITKKFPYFVELSSDLMHSRHAIRNLSERISNKQKYVSTDIKDHLSETQQTDISTRFATIRQLTDTLLAELPHLSFDHLVAYLNDPTDANCEVALKYALACVENLKQLQTTIQELLILLKDVKSNYYPGLEEAFPSTMLEHAYFSFRCVDLLKCFDVTLEKITKALSKRPPSDLPVFREVDSLLQVDPTKRSIPLSLPEVQDDEF